MTYKILSSLYQGIQVSVKYQQHNLENKVKHNYFLGIPSFYTHFLETVYQQLGERIPVWSLGHAGHELPSQYAIDQSPSLYDNQDLYNLTGQIQHKVSLFLPQSLVQVVRNSPRSGNASVTYSSSPEETVTIVWVSRRQRTGSRVRDTANGARR